MPWLYYILVQVDLAGSERVKESGSEGVRLTEAQVCPNIANVKHGSTF